MTASEKSEKRKADSRRYSQEWRERNRAAINEKNRERYAQNADAWNAQKKARRLANPEPLREADRRRAKRIYHAMSPEQKQVRSEQNKKHYHENRELRSSKKRFALYGLTDQQYKEMLNAQNNCCDICKLHADDAWKGVLAIDHCHESGKVRALLCPECNMGLAVVEKDRARVKVMEAYLDKFQAAHVKALQAVVL